MSSSSSRNFLTQPYQHQQQHQWQPRSPSFQACSASSHPTAGPAVPASPAPPSSLVHHPGLSQHLVDPVPGPAVPSLTGTDFGDLTQQGPARSGVRSARSYSSPPLASGMNASLSASSLYPGSNPSLGVQSASAAIAAVTNQRVYSLPQRSSVSGSEAYLSGNMAPEAPSWSWQGRQSNPHHFQSSSMGYDQSYHPSQSLQQEGYPFNYNVPQGSPRGYYQSGGLPSSYLSVPPAGPSQPRSASMSYALPSNAMTGNVSNMTDPSYLPSSPSYFPGQSDYYLPVSSIPTHPSIPAASSPQPPPGPAYSSPESGPASAAHASTDPDSQVRVLSFRPKPQCWEHGCNGREFSTFSNLLRHQREKSGVVAKAECHICGAAFTRTTARNIHVAQGKCKGGRESSMG